MSGYKLSGEARSDLIVIARYGDEHFGVAQSDRYRDRLTRHFELLAKQPLLFPAVEHIRAGYRRSVWGAHAVYDRVIGTEVEIMRLIGRQDFNG